MTPQPSSSGRFQSKLFNALHWRWPARVVDQLRTGSRWLAWHAQTATVIAAQVLLYPVYLVYQGGRQLYQQLTPLPAQDRKAVALPAADSVLKKVQCQTEALETLSLPPEQSGATPCNLAADLQTRQLVLVSSEGKQFDLLTPEQQQQFRQLIALEVAEYHRRQKSARRALQVSAPVATSLTLPETPTETSTELEPSSGNPIAAIRSALPMPVQVPVQVFKQLMSWMQRGPVARAVDLFGEQQVPVQDHLVEALSAQNQSLNQEHTGQEPPRQDQNELEVPGGQLVHKVRGWVEQVAKPQLVAKAHLAKANLVARVSLNKPNLPGWVQGLALPKAPAWLAPNPSAPLTQLDPKNNPELEIELGQGTQQPDASYIRGLVEAALRYFMGLAARRRTLAASVQQALSGLGGSKLLPLGAEPDPWLSMADLFVEPVAEPVEPGFQTEPVAWGEPSATQATAQANAQPVLAQPVLVGAATLERPRLAGPQRPALSGRATKRPAAPLQRREAAQPLNKTSQTSRTRQTSLVRPKVQVQQPVVATQTKTASPEIDRDWSPDWIEAQATLMGYVKSPFSRLLDWIDQWIAKLESRLLTLLDWLRAQFWP
ncbi:hypothetical protein [Leptolyngbya sp. FACHB-261]|uniref:hypothetical protein n=1 Tax=Leptolyngbya sp. FACHB-261 TaxID=2692806 RepID=UPI0016878C61|nr:hypothetical protein [Leptolyngbya sp. FACHB-261]MBD2101888.1 hypothetical protein [Leptolyngbya sp. FACHB-261]